MISLIWIIFFIILVFSIIGLFLFFILLLDSTIKGHDLATSKKTTKAVKDIILRYKPGAKNFYDLGCGRGTLALQIKNIFPHLEVYALDNSTLRIFFAKFKSRILGEKINFKKQDILESDLREANIVYTYLWYSLMPILEQKLNRELKPGTIVVTNTSHFANWQPVEKIITHPKIPDFEKLFVYLKK